MDDAEPLRRPGQGDVEVVVPAHALGDDAGRVDDEHRVELEPLGPGRRQDDRPGGEVVRGLGQRGRERVDPARRRQDGEGAVLAPRTPPRPSPPRPRGRPRSPERPREHAGRAHGLPRRRRGTAGGQHLGSDLHDLGRCAVVDRQLLLRQCVPRCGVSTSAQLVAPASDPVWATSPTSVIDRVGQRRSSSRQAIAESSCASSTITWP